MSSFKNQGLEPASYCFQKVDAQNRLDKSDARYVDIIHTDTTTFGLDESIGHVDYYPNGGTMQPGCEG